MTQQSKGKKVRNPSSDDFAHDVNVPGPLRNLRRGLDGQGIPDAPYTQDETAIIFAWLPPRRSWSADDLARARTEIEEYSKNPESAVEFLQGRLSTPFASYMREHAEAFEAALPSWFARVNAPVPDARRVLVLQAAVLRLYGLARETRPSSPPLPEALPAAWRRNVP